jgi:Tol biopolymer transport system component
MGKVWRGGTRCPRPAARFLAVAVVALLGVVLAPQAFAAGASNGLIAYDCGPNICVINADGSGAQTLGLGSRPRWSPDGSEIAFVSNSQVWLMNADGTNRVQLTNSLTGASDPSFSADGTMILYVDSGAIVQLPAALGGIATTVLPAGQASGSPGGPVASPDGSTIAFSGSDANIWLLTLAGGGLTQLTTDTGASNYNPAWSPDGSQIYFRDLPSGGGQWNIESVTPNGDASFVTSGGPIDPAPSPDGTKLAYDVVGGGLTVSNPDGSSATAVPGPISLAFEPAWQPVSQVQLVIAADNATVAAGGIDKFTVTASNPTGAPITLSSVNVSLPAGVSYIRYSSVPSVDVSNQIVGTVPAPPAMTGPIAWANVVVPPGGITTLSFEAGLPAATGTYPVTVSATASAPPLTVIPASVTAATTTSAAGTAVISPTADTFVSAANPTTNYGTADHIDSFGGTSGVNGPTEGGQDYGLLRFDLGAIPAGATITGAKIRLVSSAGFAYNGDYSQYMLFLPDDSWADSQVTYATAPTGFVGPSSPDPRPTALNLGFDLVYYGFEGAHNEMHLFPFASPNPPADDAAFTGHLTQQVATEAAGDGKLSVEIFNPTNVSGYWASFYSSRATDPNLRPELIVNYTQPASGATPAQWGVTHVFDVKRHPAFPVANQSWLLDDFMSGAYPDTGPFHPLGTSEKIQPFFVGGTCTPGVQGGAQVGLDLIDSSGTHVLEQGGYIYGLGPQGFLHDNGLPTASGYGTFFFTTPQVNNGSFTYTPTSGPAPETCATLLASNVFMAGVANATGATAQLSTAAASVAMSGSNDSIASLPLNAFAPTQDGVTPAPINGLPINGLPINGLPINGLPINGLPINGLPINGLPINGLPINGLPINGLPINGLPINGLPLDALPINGLQVPGGWTSVLAGTTLANVPLQTITLQQVLKLNPQPAAVQNLTLGQLQVADSSLGKVTIGALALGSTPINGLGLDTNSLNSLQAWCSSVTSAANCGLADLGRQSLFDLALAGAPINGLPINGLPINGLPINGLPINGLPINGLNLSASPINGLPINGLFINGSPINGLATVVDCTKIDCTTKSFGDLFGTPAAIAPGATIGTLLTLLTAAGSPVQHTLTLGDVVGLLIKRSDVPWETLSPRLLSAFDPQRSTLQLTAGFSIQGTGQGPATVAVTLPEGFDFDPGSAVLLGSGPAGTPLPDPTINGSSITWTLANITFGATYSIRFNVRAGSTVGPAQATETVTSGGVSNSSTVSFSVTDSFTGNDTPGGAPTIPADTNIEMSALPSGGAVDYYKVTLPAAGTRLEVHLTNLSADYDLALYANQSSTVRTATTNGAPLQDGTIADQPVNLQGGANAQLTPTALQDVPDPGIPVVQVSANRGTDDEDVGMVSPGTGTATIAVFGYNGASSPDPYTLRITTQAPPQVSCPARTFPFPGGGTAGSVPAISSLPNNLNTLILVNEQRIGNTYGAASETSVITSLNHLATADASLGVSGAVIPVEGLAQTQYNAWDANPCSVDAANNIANVIANEITAVKAARPSLKYVVFAGGDDQIPFFRIPDLSRIANETGFAGQFSQNEYYGALASGDLLTDDPYLDTRPIPASGRQLFVPDLVGGRLVERPDQISSAVTRFETSHATLRSSTAFVSGYDFVTDGSQLVQSRLSSILGAGSVRSLLTNTWTKATLLGPLGAFPVGGPAAINDWNGHYDNYQALPADGLQSDLLNTSNLTGANALPAGGIFFTMGCHAGFQTTDAIVGATAPDKLDWADAFASNGTSFIGNTGFGLGNTDSVAFSEELMAGLAGHLDGTLSIGEALDRAKQDYYLSRDAFSSYDEKTLAEAELYGLPMYGVGRAPAAIGAAQPAAVAAPAVSPDPVLGSTSSTSPSQSALATLTGSTSAAPFSVVPAFSTQQNGAHGSYFTNAGQVQAPNYRPLQPYVSLPATRSGLTAHGVLVDGLTSADHSNFNPDNVRPTLDLTANEPEPQFDDEAWPTKVPTLVSLNDSNGLRQTLNLTTGQFFTDAATSGGVERLWTNINGRVTYSSSADFVPPSIDSIDSFISNGVVSFTGSFSDLDQNGNPGTVALAQVVYDVDNNGTWQALPLQKDSTTGNWTGGAPFAGTHVQFFVEACDLAGNCGFSSNKGRYFDAQPLPVQSGSISLTPDRQPDTAPAQWYTHSVTVTASTTGTGTVTVSVDGGPFLPASGPVTLAGDGAHIVDAQSSDGAETTAVFLIDGVGPKVTPTVSPAAPDGTNGWYKSAPTVTFTCTDDLSGVKAGTCLVNGGSSNHVTLGQSASAQSVSASAQDNAGNSGTGSVSVPKIDLTDPAVPTFNGIQNGQHFTAGGLPPLSVLSCSSSDALSGLAGCVLSGYSSAAGAHVLTATATDNAGRTKTATLTYTVVASTLDGKLLLSRLFRIYVLNPVTGTATKLTGSVGPYDDQPARSPDGQKILFARRSTLLGASQLWVMNADGSSPKQLTTTTGDSANPRWSPDGSQVAFQSTRPTSKGYDVWVANWNAATSTLSGYVDLTNANGNDIGPTWSPVSTGKIAFASDRVGGQFDLYTMTTSGGSQTRLTTEPRADFDPAWSPDGTKIAFSSNQAADAGSFEIYLMDAGGGNTRRLTTQLGVQRAPYWASATRLDFTSNKLFGGGIAGLDVTTSQAPVRITGSILGDANPG